MAIAEIFIGEGVPYEHPSIVVTNIADNYRELTTYNADLTPRVRSRNIGRRRLLLSRLDESLKAFKDEFPPDIRTTKGKRISNPNYRAVSRPFVEFRKSISSVQSADRRTLIGKL